MIGPPHMWFGQFGYVLGDWGVSRLRFRDACVYQIYLGDGDLTDQIDQIVTGGLNNNFP